MNQIGLPAADNPLSAERGFGTKYQIVDGQTQPDGSIIIHIKKQYLNHNCDE